MTQTRALPLTSMHFAKPQYLGIRPTVIFCCVSAVVLLAHAENIEAGSTSKEPLSEGELYVFFQDLGVATARCDIDWIERHYLPTVTITDEILGYPPFPPSERGSYFKWLRKTCIPDYPSFQPFDQLQAARSVSPDRASYTWKSGPGPQRSDLHILSYLGIKARDVESSETTFTVVRDDAGEIKIQSIHSVLELRPNVRLRTFGGCQSSYLSQQ